MERLKEKPTGTITTTEAAEALGVSVKRIHQFNKDGRLTSVGRYLEEGEFHRPTHLYMQAQVERFAAARKIVKG